MPEEKDCESQPPSSEHAARLLEYLQANRASLSPLLILPHDFPDPDATDVGFHVEATASLSAGWTTNGTTVELDTPTLLRARYDTPVASSANGYIRLRVSRP